ncbi:hypothetical protein Tco_0839550 [Tanacetum coccineum]|uniref:Uncharacterized protein n=1 Tax=Tanacetum coccineum TaxID=301880 RepID=A0ABQ5AV23_9ASTR
MPPSSVTTLPPPPIPLVQPQQQTPVPTPTIVPSTSLQNLPTFGSLFKFEDRVKALEDDFLEFKQTNLFVEVVSSIPAEVLTRSSNQAKTSHAVAANLYELELKKILIDKIKSSKSIHRSVQQKTLYKALVDAYETDKVILETYGDTVTFKRRRDDKDEDEEPSAGSNRGSKRRRAGKEPESTSAPKEKTSKSTGKSKEGSKTHQADEPTHTVDDLEEPTHQEFDTGISLKRESARDVYSKHRILAVTQLKIVEWHNYKHLDWITIRRNDNKLYTFKEGDYNRLRLQDIEDMLLLLVQGKLTNLNVEERLALGVSLRMFTRSIVLRRRVEDLQLGVKIYQKKLNLTRPDTYRSDLKRKSAYTAYSNPKGFIYQNKDKKNRLMCIDKHYKFSDGTLNDVQSALDDILKRIQMEYLPQTVWRNVDRERARAMIQAIDRQLRNIRLMRSLEKFIGVRLYRGDLRLLERTI